MLYDLYFVKFLLYNNTKGKPDMAQYPEIFMYITLPVGVSLYILAYVFWRVSLWAYKSSGN